MTNMGIIWFAAFVVFLIVEAATYQLVSIYFAFGAVGALITYLLGFGIAAQVVVFFVISGISLALLKGVFSKLKKNKLERTNVDRFIGEKVYITKEVDNIKESGEGKINGTYWTVRSADNKVIPKDAVAVVEKIEGVKLIVKEN